jgi:ABC-type Na+ efflux pump permease subunit
MLKKTIFLIILIVLIGVFLPLDKLMAEDEGYEIEVSIPSFGDGAKAGQKVTLIDYVRYIYLFALAAVGVTALGVLVYGGFQYMASDLVTSKEEAKKWIWGALSGLVLALAAYLILNTINPDLVKIKEPELPEIKLPEAQTKEFKSKEETAKTIRYNFDAKAEAYNTMRSNRQKNV